MEAIFLKTALKIAIWVFFRGLRPKSGDFLGFSKIISDEHTYHFYIKNPVPPGPEDQREPSKNRRRALQIGIVSNATM